MCIVYVTYLETSSLPRKTSWTKGRKTSLMCQLCQWIILVHKLGQLGTSEEFLYCCCYRFDVNEGLWCNAIHILSSHTFTNHSLHTGQTDAVLILKQLAYCTNSAVAQMIDVIRSADLLLQMHIIVNRSKNIFFGNVFWYQFTYISVNGRF